MKEVLTKYAAAVQSKNMEEIEKHVIKTEAFSIFEGSHVNLGWTDYRDHHIGPELEAFREIQYSYEDIKARVNGDMAYATCKSQIAVKMESRDFEGESLVTVVLVRTDKGWKIQHMHTSRIPKKAPSDTK